MSKARFITLEGGEGTGKSTQARLLAQALAASGISCMATREPGGSEGAEEIRNLIVNGAPGRWHPVTESLLFFAARFDHVERRIMPALANGQWVICDRFFDSTRVYQGIGKGLGDGWLREIYASTIGSLAPDLTFVLDLAPEAGLKRAHDRGGNENRFEQMDIGFHEKLRSGFLGLAKAEPQRFVVLDASVEAQRVHEALIEEINQRFGLAIAPASV